MRRFFPTPRPRFLPLSSGTPLSGWPGGVARHVLEQVDSTNAEAMRMAPALSGPTWIMARRQTAGRGRRGRATGPMQGQQAELQRPDTTFEVDVNVGAQARERVDVVLGLDQHTLEQEGRAFPVTVQPADIHARPQFRDRQLSFVQRHLASVVLHTPRSTRRRKTSVGVALCILHPHRHRAGPVRQRTLPRASGAPVRASECRDRRRRPAPL